ncbi:RNA-binding domain-containing protein [uncultured Slackia sp.]|uniref:RNA-binding domain-containing protein n=1 Tax=uncultured Slackia sp. TaxID=665903 RepID=UPI0034A287A6
MNSTLKSYRRHAPCPFSFLDAFRFQSAQRILRYREWHGNKADLLHDIICMANNPEDTTGLLIIGIDEEEDFQPTGGADLLGERRNTQSIVDMLRAKSWADGVPKVRVASIELGNACVDVVLIDHDSESLPYYLTADYGNGRSIVRAGAVYTRNADSNTPKKETANPLETERLWRRHFGLDKTPLERLPQLLSEPSKWVHTLPI